MLLSSINTHSVYSRAYNNAMHPNNSQNANYLPGVEPVAPIGTSNFETTDTNEIDYERVNDFIARKTAVSTNTNQSSMEQQSTETTSQVAENENAEHSRRPATTGTSPEEPTNGPANQTEDTKANGEALSEEEQVMVNELKTRDAEVRQHEQAHLAAAGGIAAGGASYSYQSGPDGKQYAVGGEVNIDTSAEGTPDATIKKMNRVIAAAMAPAEPSGQDFSVASAARRTIAEMSRMKTQQNQAEQQNSVNEVEQPQPATTPAPISSDSTPVAQSPANTTTSSTINSNTNPSDSSQQVAQQSPVIEEPISTLSARNIATRQSQLYKNNELNSTNSLYSSSINVIVA